MRIEVFNIWYR